jgi:phosphoadenosine phosphosulfate reductase
MFQLIIKKGMLPLRQCRFCCDFLKERNGINSLVITGITKFESVKRSKRPEFESTCHKKGDKVLLNPILNWTVFEVFEFLKSISISVCSLYDFQNRIGCIGCPMAPKQMRADFIRFPKFLKAYTNTVERLMTKEGKYSQFESAEDVMKWWTSGLSRSVYLSNKDQFKLLM